MFIELGGTYTFLFPTHDATMAAHDADALPTAEVYEDDGDASMYTPTVEQVGALTGLYRVIVEVTAANGFTVGKSYNVIATVVMGGITMNVRVDCFAPEVIAGAGIISVDTPWLVGELPTGGTVTIKLYDSNGAGVLLDDDACAEIGVTGFYWWDTGNISVYPAHPGSYLFVMRDSVSGRQYWNTAVIGTPESLDVSAVWDELKVDHVIAGSFGESVAAIQDQTDLMSFTGNDIKATLDGEKVAVSSIDNGVIAAATFAADAIDSNVLATSAAEEISDVVWDEILTGATHNIPTSAGRRLRQIASAVVIDGTAVTATSNSITLDAAASSTNGAYDPSLIYISTGKGAGQCRLILQYVGATKVATVDRNWKDIPDATSEYVIIGDAGREHVNEGLAQGGGALTITLNANASSSDGAYVGQVVFIRSGTGEDQARRITAYNGATKVATTRKAWDVIPDTTSGYVMLPTAELDVDKIYTGIWSYVRTGLEPADSAMDKLHEILTDVIRVDGLIEDDGGGNDRFTAKALEESPGADVASIVDGVWDEAMAAHILPGTTGETLATAGAGGDPAAIADAVWDELLITHLNPGSAGEALETAGSAGITSADLENISTTTAEKVWDEPEKDHRRLNTFGDAIREIRDKCISGEEPSRGGRTKGR